MSLLPKKPWPRRIVLTILICSISTFLTGFIYAGPHLFMLPAVWATAGLWHLNFAVAGLIIRWVVLRLSYDRMNRVAFFALHFLAAVFVAALLTGLAFLDLRIFALPEIEEYLYTMYPQYFNIGIFIYAAIAGWMYMMDYHRRSKEQAVLEVDLKRLAKEAELRALKAQINPHFLFNALNSVNALIGESPETAREMNMRLGNILRYALDGSEKQYVRLEEELEFIDDYLRIEKLRLGERMSVKVDVDAALLGVLIPPMTLEPIVENSIKHGIANRKAGGKIGISVSASGGNVRCVVSDTGAGLEPGNEETILGRGIGLRNTLERLKRLYEEAFTFDIRDNEPTGCTVTISFPARGEAR